MTYEQTRDFMKEAYIVLERQGKKFALPHVFNCIEALEKQIPKRVKAKSKRDFTIDDFKGIRNTRYYCPCCNKSVKHYTKYCDNCGQRLIFPQVRYSDYIEGVVQKSWLDWSDT